MLSSTVNSKKFINSKNTQYEQLDLENSDQLSTPQENVGLQSHSWSEGRVKDEISSFIAEFSYLADGNEERRPHQNRPRISLQTYQVYPAQMEDKSPNTVFYSHKNTSVSKPHRKKNIGWKSTRNPHLEISDRNKTESHLFNRRGENMEREISHTSTHNGKIEDEKYITIKKRPTINNRSRSRSMKKSLKRSRSRRRKNHKPRPHSYYKSKTRSPLGNIEYPYTQSKRRIRSRSTDSHIIKYIPLRYGRNKSRRRRFMSAIKTDIKTPITTPSIVTLYPSNPIKREELIFPRNQEFFIDSHIACKCYKCMKKYKSLIKLSANKQRPDKEKLKIHRDKIQCQEDKIEYYGEGVSPWEQSNRCTNPAKIECEKSFYLKFNSYCQHVDSKITQYFHSILDKASYI